MKNSPLGFAFGAVQQRFDFLLKLSAWTGWTALTQKLNGGQK